MENKKRKVQPNDFNSVEDFVRASFSRKGSKNKFNPTLHLKEIYSKSGCKDVVDYNTFVAIFKEVCRNIRKMLVKGHAVKFPFFGTLQATEFDYTNSKRDNRPLNFKKMLEKKFGIQNDDEPIRGEMIPAVSFFFYHKYSSPSHQVLHNALFLPMKYLVREYRNIKFGTNYYIHPYD